ncbi:hypothetical protein ACFFRR_005168 [Megaselia abdita]
MLKELVLLWLCFGLITAEPILDFQEILDEHCNKLAANDLTGPQKRDIFSAIKEKGPELIQEEIIKIVPNCRNDGVVKLNAADKELLVAEVPESRDTSDMKEIELSSDVVVGNVHKAHPHFVQKSSSNQHSQLQRKKNGNMRRQFRKGNIVRIQGKTYRVVKVVDQPTTNHTPKRLQFQRQHKNKKQQVAGKQYL